MPKKTTYQIITPIPSHIPRQLAIDMLHSHGEIIELNPLVIEHRPVKAPRDAPADEFFSQWHEITERIQYIPGTGKLGSGKINFRGVFHDMPWGLQTHIYAPAGVDLRNTYRIGGNQPGEPPEKRELGSNMPADGLYLKEDVEIKCNFTMIPFVKNSLKAATKVMLERLIKKAELIDAEILRQMMNAGLGQTQSSNNSNPSTAHIGYSPGAVGPGSPPMQPTGLHHSPSMNSDSGRPQNSMLANSAVLRNREDALRQSMYLNDPRYRSGQWNPPDNQYGVPSPQPGVSEMMGTVPYQQQQYSNPGLAIEMPGDFYHPSPPPARSPQLIPRHSARSELSADEGTRVSGNSRPNSTVHENVTLSSGWGGSQTSSSPRPEQNNFQNGGYKYNPMDFATTGR